MFNRTGTAKIINANTYICITISTRRLSSVFLASPQYYYERTNRTARVRVCVCARVHVCLWVCVHLYEFRTHAKAWENLRCHFFHRPPPIVTAALRRVFGNSYRRNFDSHHYHYHYYYYAPPTCELLQLSRS